MCWSRIRQLLLDPTKAIAEGKREKDSTQTVIILIVEWLLAALAVYILVSKLATTTQFTATFAAAMLSISALVIGILSTLFFAFLIQLVFHVLGGKGKYLSGLMTAVYGKFPIIFGFFLASLLSYVPFIGVLIGVATALVFVVSGLATFYRAAREFFAVDLLTAWIGLTLIIAAVVLVFYLVALPLFLSSLSQINFASMMWDKTF